MDYKNALDYILSFADYERWPGAGYAERWDLRRMDELLQRLGSPHLTRKTVHIAGSKGKGSTAAMVASTLSAADYRTGLYTSPHLHTMRERVKVDDQLITEQEFADLVTELEPQVEEQNRGKYGALSTFEILTTLAFLHFHKKGADYQVLETGLGGRLDATNVTIPEVCILTSISLDHTAVLGDTIAQIATEKAGIIKSGVPVVSSPQVPEAAEVIKNVCTEKDSRLILVGEDISWERKESALNQQHFEVAGLNGHYDLAIPLLGEHQLENAVTAVGALEILDVGQQHILSGLANVSWSGRLEILRQEPLLIADGAHNGDSAKRLVESLKKDFQFDQSVLIMGTSADKNSVAMVAEFAPFFNQVITTTSQHPRATDSKLLAAEFAEYSVKAQIALNVEEAITKALEMAGKEDIICATGSLFLIAEVIEKTKNIVGERYPNMEPKKV